MRETGAAKGAFCRFAAAGRQQMDNLNQCIFYLLGVDNRPCFCVFKLISF